MRRTLFILLVCFQGLTPAVGHQPLLPAPQQIQYGGGQLPLRGLSIQVATPSPEDQFAATELSSYLSRRVGTTIPLVTGKPSGPVITLTRTGAVDVLPGADDHAGPDSREAYEVRIDTRGAEIRARSSAGLYYGVQTMRQLVEGEGSDAALPEVSLHDWPAMAYRGFMMDTSHGPLPTEAEIKRQIDFLARWKANQYYFYSEASIELRGYDLVNPGARYTEEQVRHIIAYARARHVDVVPTGEFYGHLHDVFRMERYADLSLLPHSGEINPRNERTQVLVADWIQQLAALFPSPWFHIGFDEPWELDRTKDLLGADPSSLYIERLKQTVALVEKAGKRPMFWADVQSGAHIFQKYPDLFSQLPKSVIAVPWVYDPRPDYSDFVAPFARQHIQQVVAPAIACYGQISPDFYYTFANIDGLVRDGRKSGALGVINTGWTDSGQMLYRASLPGMAYGAVAGWQTPPINQAQFFSDYSIQMYPAQAAADVAIALDKLSAAEATLAKTLGRGRTIQQIWADPFAPELLARAESSLAALREERLLAEDAQERAQRALASTGDTYSLPSLLVNARMLDYAGMKYIYSGEIGGFFRNAGKNPSRTDIAFLSRQIVSWDHGRVADLMDMLTTAREMYRSAWQDEYTDYRLGVELRRWDLEYEYWARFQMRMEDLFRTFKDGDSLPTLEELRPHF